MNIQQALNQKVLKKLWINKELNKKGTTIILVTHDINIVYQYANDVFVMNNGKIELLCINSLKKMLKNIL